METLNNLLEVIKGEEKVAATTKAKVAKVNKIVAKEKEMEAKRNTRSRRQRANASAKAKRVPTPVKAEEPVTLEPITVDLGEGKMETIVRLETQLKDQAHEYKSYIVQRNELIDQRNEDFGGFSEADEVVLEWTEEQMELMATGMRITKELLEKAKKSRKPSIRRVSTQLTKNAKTVKFRTAADENQELLEELKERRKGYFDRLTTALPKINKILENYIRANWKTLDANATCVSEVLDRIGEFKVKLNWDLPVMKLEGLADTERVILHPALVKALVKSALEVVYFGSTLMLKFNEPGYKNLGFEFYNLKPDFEKAAVQIIKHISGLELGVGLSLDGTILTIANPFGEAGDRSQTSSDLYERMLDEIIPSLNLSMFDSIEHNIVQHVEDEETSRNMVNDEVEENNEVTAVGGYQTWYIKINLEDELPCVNKMVHLVREGKKVAEIYSNFTSKPKEVEETEEEYDKRRRSHAWKIIFENNLVSYNSKETGKRIEGLFDKINSGSFRLVDDLEETYGIEMFRPEHKGFSINPYSWAVQWIEKSEEELLKDLEDIVEMEELDLEI